MYARKWRWTGETPVAPRTVPSESELRFAGEPRQPLHFQLRYRRATATFILRRLSHRLHLRMLLQKLAQRFAQNSHAAAVNNSYSWQARQESPVQKLFDLARGVIHSVPDHIDL